MNPFSLVITGGKELSSITCFISKFRLSQIRIVKVTKFWCLQSN